MSTRKKPLEGVKVVELATFIAAATTGRFLADLGADVIKIERCISASRARHTGRAAACWTASLRHITRASSRTSISPCAAAMACTAYISTAATHPFPAASAAVSVARAIRLTRQGSARQTWIMSSSVLFSTAFQKVVIGQPFPTRDCAMRLTEA